MRLKHWSYYRRLPIKINNFIKSKIIFSKSFESELTTYHFPLLPIQLHHGGQRAGRGGRCGGFGRGGRERFWSGTYYTTLSPQGRILVGLLVFAHMLQAWRGQGRTENTL